MQGICDAFLAWYTPGKSDNDKDLDWILPIAAWATSAELELSVHLLCLTQETSEKNAPNVLLQHLLHKLQQMHAQFKLSAGSPRRDKQDQSRSLSLSDFLVCIRPEMHRRCPAFELFSMQPRLKNNFQHELQNLTMH